MKRKLTYDSDEEELCNSDTYVSVPKYENKLFEPVHFLRCHSKKNDAADVQTQVWQCAFEPDMDSPGRTTNIIATCGGNSICFIDVVTGTVVKKFYSERPSILLFTLAWTTLHLGGGRRCNILAVGGAKGYLQLLLPSKSCSLLSSFPKPPGNYKKKDIMSCMAFHPSRRSILFCGASNGVVAAWEIGQSHPWSDFPEPKSPQLLFSMSAHSEIFSISLSKHSHILLTGCNTGLYGWSLNEVNWERDLLPHQRRLDIIEFELPKSDEDGKAEQVSDDDSCLVDSVVCIPESSLVATKCALRGVIYLWDLKSTVEKLEKISSHKNLGFKSTKLHIHPLKSFRWSDTDDYFMAMGCSPDGNLLSCGDDEGGVWLYNIGSNLAEHKAKRVKKDQDNGLLKEPFQRLMWPTNLEDPDVQNARKVKRLEGHGGVIDQVSLGVSKSGCIHLTAVTSTNLVCIWRAFDEEDIHSHEGILE